MTEQDGTLYILSWEGPDGADRSGSYPTIVKAGAAAEKLAREGFDVHIWRQRMEFVEMVPASHRPHTH